MGNIGKIKKRILTLLIIITAIVIAVSLANTPLNIQATIQQNTKTNTDTVENTFIFPTFIHYNASNTNTFYNVEVITNTTSTPSLTGPINLSKNEDTIMLQLNREALIYINPMISITNGLNTIDLYLNLKNKNTLSSCYYLAQSACYLIVEPFVYSQPNTSKNNHYIGNLPIDLYYF